MKNKLLSTLVASSALLTSHLANADLIDLSSWTSEGQGSWTVQGANNDTVFQNVNGEPTVFFEAGSNARDTAISGEITVTTSSDDDFIGFVLGYQAGELHNANADYWLIDWKQNDQVWNGNGTAGLALSHVVDGSVANSFWNHSGGVNEIARGTNLGSTGWQDYTKYSFDITHTANLIEVRVNDILELSITAAQAGVAEFTDGAYGFYNYSQSQVEYAGITSRVVSVSEPATLGMLSIALLGLANRRRKA